MGGENQISACTFLIMGQSLQGQALMPLILEKSYIESKCFPANLLIRPNSSPSIK